MGKLVNSCAGAELKKRPNNVDAILISAPEHGSSKRKIEKARLLQQHAKPMFFMIDSGGSQLLGAEKSKWKITHDPDQSLIYRYNSKEINLAPKHVMEFASSFKPDIVFALDFPFRKLKTAAEREVEYAIKNPLNVRWAYKSARWKQKLCPEAQLFQPIQAYYPEHATAFLSSIAGINYDGVAIPIREAKFHEIAVFLTIFYQHGIEQVHLLGTASFLKIAMAAFMANTMFKWVSLDAATWNKAAFRCGFLNPMNLKRVDLRQTVKLDPDLHNDCLCPYCQSQGFSQIQKLPNKKKFELLRQHNWWAIEKITADLWANSASLIQLERFLKDRDIKPAEIDKLINTLALVDCMKYDDIEILQTVLTPIPKRRKQSRLGERIYEYTQTIQKHE